MDTKPGGSILDADYPLKGVNFPRLTTSQGQRGAGEGVVRAEWGQAGGSVPLAVPGVVGAGLDASQVPRIYKAMAANAGLPPIVVEGLSGHSTRVGAAQDMIAGGIGMAAVLHAGRWKSTTMVNRYGERLLARRSGGGPACPVAEKGVGAMARFDACAPDQPCRPHRRRVRRCAVPLEVIASQIGGSTQAPVSGQVLLIRVRGLTKEPETDVYSVGYAETKGTGGARAALGSWLSRNGVCR